MNRKDKITHYIILAASVVVIAVIIVKDLSIGAAIPWGIALVWTVHNLIES